MTQKCNSLPYNHRPPGATVAAGKGVGYINREGDTCMTRCFKCGKENYAMTVSSGYCAWCGYDANEGKDRLEDHLG